MKLASRSAIESDNSAKAGSKASRGASDAPPILALPDSRREEREEGRSGVVGRERGLRLPDVDLFVLLPACGVVEDDIIAYSIVRLGNLHGDSVYSVFSVFTSLQRLPLRDAIVFSHLRIYFSAAPRCPRAQVVIMQHSTAQLER